MAERLTVLHTDLRPSETLPTDDAVPSSYFDVLRTVLSREGGSLVHTARALAVAIVPRPVCAVRAVLRAHEQLAYGPAQSQPPFVKAGAHLGLYQLDSAGLPNAPAKTIDLAAHSCALSQGGEVVVSDAVRFDAEVEALLLKGVIAADRFAVNDAADEGLRQFWRIYALVRRWGQC
jgi:class 3 adenylate cyclase